MSKPKGIWMLRRAGQYPNGCVSVMPSGRLVFEYFPDRNPSGDTNFNLSRADARLLAKRILECLEATK